VEVDAVSLRPDADGFSVNRIIIGNVHLLVCEAALGEVRTNEEAELAIKGDPRWQRASLHSAIP